MLNATLKDQRERKKTVSPMKPLNKRNSCKFME